MMICISVPSVFFITKYDTTGLLDIETYFSFLIPICGSPLVELQSIFKVIAGVSVLSSDSYRHTIRPVGV